MNRRLNFDWIRLKGDWQFYRHYHLEWLRAHGNRNTYWCDHPFDVDLVRQAAYKYAKRHGIKLETKFYPLANELVVVRCAKGASILHRPSLAKLERLADEERRAKKRKRRERFNKHATGPLCRRKRRTIETAASMV